MKQIAGKYRDYWVLWVSIIIIVSDMANFELRSFDTEFISRTLLSPVDMMLYGWLKKLPSWYFSLAFLLLMQNIPALKVSESLM